eukprot:3137230-Lingulodinium_polyedra.AAC.1
MPEQARAGMQFINMGYSAAISTCGMAAQWWLALGLLAQLPRAGLQLSTIGAVPPSACAGRSFSGDRPVGP